MAEITIIPGTIQLIKMTDQEYFSEKYKDYISNSKLGLINPDEDGSVEKFKSGFKTSYSESFELGSAIHAAVLQPDYYTISDINKPTGKLGMFAEEVFKYRQEGLTIQQSIILASGSADYYAGKFTANRAKTAIKSCLPFYLQRMKLIEDLDKSTIFLPASTKNKFDECMINIQTSKILQTLYPEGLLGPIEFYNEFAILCEVEIADEETGEIIKAKLKAKLDNFTIDHESQTITLNDLKTTSKPINYFMGNYVATINAGGETVKEWYNGSFQKYHYYRQLGMYLWLLQCAVKEIYNLTYQSKVNMLVIETIPEYKSKIYSVNGKQIQAGLKEFKTLLTLAIKHD